MPRLRVPPGEKQSGEQSQISCAYSQKSGKDQWDCEIGNYYAALPLQQKIVYLYSSIHTFFERV